MIRKFSAVLLFAALVGVPAPGLSETFYVPDDFGTIQAAIDAAGDLYTIVVRDGIWTGPGNKDLVFQGKEITLQSENGPASCIIDCEGDGKGVYFENNETKASVLDGFTITNAYAEYGAISCFYSSPTITNCIITGNTSEPSGGAGIHCYASSPLIRDCEITGNSTTSSSGGGIKCNESSSPTIVRCVISGNSSAVTGGGIACFESSPYIANCIITDNTSVSYGGGIFCHRWSDPRIINCTISGNTADEGGGVGTAGRAEPTITNSILRQNSAPTGPEISLIEEESPSLLTVEYSNVEGGEAAVHVEPDSTLIWGEGNIDEDPLFVGAGDFHLTAGSPCMDVGTGVDAPGSDIDRDFRPQGSGWDIGADEYIAGIAETVLSLVPDSTLIPRGGALEYDVSVENLTDTSITFDYWTNVTLPDARTFPFTGELFGPYGVTMDAFGSRTGHLSHAVAGSAPRGIYTYNAYVGAYPTNVIGEYHFDFEIVASP
jgi:parallel beta-helix repeat protein